MNRLTTNDTVIFLGDWLHAQGKQIDKDVFHLAYMTWEEMSNSCREIIMLPGNHDLYRGRVGIFRPLRKIAHVVTGPEVRNVDDYTLYLLPYTNRRDIFLGMVEAAERIQNEDRPGKVICAHVGIMGAKLGINEYMVKEPIYPSDILNHADLGILGHYHKHQIVEQHVHYVGSPFQIDFSEMGIAKGYLTQDSTRLQFHELSSPQFWVVPINKPEDFQKFLDNRKDDDYYKLVVRTKKIAEGDFKDLGSNVVVNREIRSKAHRRVHKIGGDPSHLIDYYVDHTQTDLDKDTIKSMARKLFQRRNI